MGWGCSRVVSGRLSLMECAVEDDFYGSLEEERPGEGEKALIRKRPAGTVPPFLPEIETRHQRILRGHVMECEYRDGKDMHMHM